MNKRLGELLIEAGTIDDGELRSALALQKQYSSKIGELLINQGVCSEDDVLNTLSIQLSLPRLADWMKHDELPVEMGDVDLLDMSSVWWLNQQAFPLGMHEGAIWIMKPDVLDSFVADVVGQGREIQVMPVISSSHELRQLLAIFEDGEGNDVFQDTDLLQDMATGAPIIKFVNDTIQRALDAHASDIHFESYRGVFRIRFRVDGVLHEVDRPNMGMQAAVVSRLKLMAALDISEKRLPQDGRIRMRVGGVEIDIRVATSPGVAGESVVLRLLVSQEGVVSLDKLSMHEDHRRVSENLLLYTNGILLVTGPTGSGKSTSLYAFLRHLANDERKIITVEDPVEYQTQGITQIPVNTEIGLTFASILRSVLRQDPDIILVGEIRDKETAEIAVQAALTGHLVLSTLHTNDAPSAFVRLMDMGVEPYMLASSILGVVAQRLVRKVCSKCAVEDTEGRKKAYLLGFQEIVNRWPELAVTEQFVKGGGCEHCLGSGYSGRRSIFEMFAVDDDIRHVLATKPDHLSECFAAKDLRRLRQDGLIFAAQSETTVEEVIRVTG